MNAQGLLAMDESTHTLRSLKMSYLKNGARPRRELLSIRRQLEK
jgi:hypothetical protein